MALAFMNKKNAKMAIVAAVLVAFGFVAVAAMSKKEDVPAALSSDAPAPVVQASTGKPEDLYW